MDILYGVSKEYLCVWGLKGIVIFFERIVLSGG